MQLKENFFKNKQKYKSILFVLSKMRQKNNENIDNKELNHTEINIDKIVELLDCENIEDIFINKNLNNLNKEEELELQNFEINEGLLKEIESSLLKKIKKILDEEKIGNINNNEIIPQNNINKRWKNLGIEKGDNISFDGDGINCK